MAAQSHEQAVLATQAAIAANAKEIQAAMQAQAVELERARGDAARAKSDAEHQIELARRDTADAKNAVAALTAQIDKLSQKP